MPKYDYKCNNCGLIFEADEPDLLVKNPHRKDGDPVNEKTSAKLMCPGKFKRIYNFGGPIFRGSGFYRTDNRKSG